METMGIDQWNKLKEENEQLREENNFIKITAAKIEGERDALIECLHIIAGKSHSERMGKINLPGEETS